MNANEEQLLPYLKLNRSVYNQGGITFTTQFWFIYVTFGRGGHIYDGHLHGIQQCFDIIITKYAQRNVENYRMVID